MSLSISVALATYNGARYLPAQLATLAAQSQTPAELVVGDDGSTDDTLRILEDFARGAAFPVRITRNPARLGYRANFVAIAERCTGEAIAFCDQDDLWREDKLATVADCLDSSGCLLVYHNALLIDAEERPLGPFYDAPPQAPLATRLSLPPWHFAHGFAIAFRRSLLGPIDAARGLPDPYHRGEMAGHDILAFMLASTLGAIAYVDAPLVRYRQHAAQTLGMGGAASRWSRWLARLEDRRATYAHATFVARRMAAICDGLGAAEGAQAWSILAGLYARRNAAADAPSAWSRLAAWRDLRRAGAYGEGVWTFGRRAALKDALLGVALAPLVRRYGREGGPDITCRRGAAPFPA